jgi:hypothetical protein
MDSTGAVYISGDVYTPGGTQGVCDDGDILPPNITDPLLASEPGFGPPNVPPQGVVWPDSDNVVIMTPQTHPDYATSGNLDNWIDLQDFGIEYYSQCNDWIGILFQFTGEGGGDNEPVGFFYNAGDGVVDPWVFLKFYDDCGGTSGNGGWHIRHWIIRTELAVELTGDRPPVFEVCPLPTTFPNLDRTTCILLRDDNPSGGSVGVDSVYFMYTLDSLTGFWNSIEMYLVDGDSTDGRWECVVPGQAAGTSVYWYIIFSDVGNSSCYGYGYGSSTPIYSYYIFEPTPGNDLIYNNQDPLYGNILYSSYLYFYWGGEPFDIWDASYGGIIDELTEHYSTIIELGSYYNNDAEIAAWWDAYKTYIVSSDEWLGVRSGWTDGPTADGSVAKSILGIAYEYNDINYAAPGNQSGISRLMADIDEVAGVLAGFLSDSLYLNYDPDYETGRRNWLDGVGEVEGYTVDMTGYSLVLDSADQVTPSAGSEEYNVMIHGHAGNGGKSAFLAFDAIALNTVPSYHWVGASWYMVNISSTPDISMPQHASPLIAVYEGILSVDDDIAGTPKTFSLKNNYPNPFNPVTNIHYELHQNTYVEITIYDILGREVKKLVSGYLVSGYHEATWNGTNDLGIPVAAGIYFYKVEAGNFTQTKKMILLK